MPLEERVIQALRDHRLTLACAESMTGGLFGGRLTQVAGASDVFRGGVISYKDDVKAALLRVDAKVLEEKGAVTSIVARQMALGARDLLRADIAVSITGFAGPKVPPGGTAGQVYIGLAHAGGAEVKDLLIEDDRTVVREETVQEALALILDAIPRAVAARDARG